MIEKVFELIDEKIKRIEEDAKFPAVIIINADLYKNMQLHLLDLDLAQSNGKIRSPYSLNSYNGVKIVPSQVVSIVEVY